MTFGYQQNVFVHNFQKHIQINGLFYIRKTYIQVTEIMLGENYSGEEFVLLNLVFH